MKFIPNMKGVLTLKDWLSIHKVKIFIVSIAVVILVCYLNYRSSKETELMIGVAEQGSIINEMQEKEVETKENKTIVIMVDVKGAVNIPGVYHAEEGQRVLDLINKAGGFTNEADSNQVNLSQHIEDEMVIFVPVLGETVDVMQNAPTSVQNKLLDINKATDSELQTLPGIGPSKAIAIIEFREKNGGFQTIEDLKKISGIGEKTFEKLASLITVK
jgi:competence protein ComEA